MKSGGNEQSLSSLGWTIESTMESLRFLKTRFDTGFGVSTWREFVAKDRPRIWFEGEWEKWLAETPRKEKASRKLQDIWEEFMVYVEKRKQIEQVRQLEFQRRDKWWKPGE